MVTIIDFLDGMIWKSEANCNLIQQFKHKRSETPTKSKHKSEFQADVYNGESLGMTSLYKS